MSDPAGMRRHAPKAVGSSGSGGGGGTATKSVVDAALPPPADRPAPRVPAGAWERLDAAPLAFFRASYGALCGGALLWTALCTDELEAKSGPGHPLPILAVILCDGSGRCRGDRATADSAGPSSTFASTSRRMVGRRRSACPSRRPCAVWPSQPPVAIHPGATLDTTRTGRFPSCMLASV
jgi:hypothetical protein